MQHRNKRRKDLTPVQDAMATAPGSASKRKYMRRQKRMRVWTAVFCVILAIYVAIGVTGAAVVQYMTRDMPTLDINDFVGDESSRVYDANGNLLIELGTYFRENVSYDKMPESLVDAFLSIEDSRFFEHNGFDIPRFTSSAIHNVLSGDLTGQGGSTFTMQLVKNSYFSVDNGDASTSYSAGKGIKYKIQQIMLSLQLEQKLDKKTIFELYVNRLNFGNNIRGCEMASRYYFGKDVWELNLSESAMLAGIVNLPNYYNPYAHLDYATQRRDQVLYMMLYHGYITEEEYKLATSIKVEDELVGEYADIKESNTKYQEYIDMLQQVHNLVLTGAPGTGKTFMAQAIAEEMGAVTRFVQFHPSYDYTDFVEGLRPIEKSDGQMGFERKDGAFKDFCREAIKNLIDSEKSVESLTKEMSWQEKLDRFVEDAIEEGTKFKTVNGSEFVISEMKSHSIVIHNEQNEKTTQVAVNADEILELLTNEVPLNIVRDIRNYFKRKFGTQPDSYAFVITKAVRAMKQKMPVVEANKIDRKHFVFIIDEINRGEASKIFGELFYAIDPGYRGKKEHLVQTQYQNLVPETDTFAKGFYVPENVYILATMNDIDRSVESMDFAMRRRFTWKEVTPADTESMLDSLPCAKEAKATMGRLNNAIAETDGLGAAYMVGPSYFLKLGENGGDFAKLWKMNIEPLLKEYLRGFRKTAEILDKFRKAYFEKKEESATDEVELIDED